MRPVFERIVTIALLAASSVSAASWILSYQSATGDTGHSVRLAYACVYLDPDQCRAMGNYTSALGLSHGASFVRLVSQSLRRGGNLRSVQITLVVLLMASAAVAFFVIRRSISPSAGFLALLFYLPVTLAGGGYFDLANSNLLSLPLVLYYASAALCVQTGSAAAGAVAAIFLAFAMSANVSSVLMIPFHLALVALFARRPLAAVAVSSLSVTVTFTLESYDAARNLGGWLLGMPATPVLLAITAVLLGSRPLRRRVAALLQPVWRQAQQLRARLTSLPVRLRLRAVMKAAVVYISVAIWSGSVLVMSGGPGSRYLGPLVFPLLFVAVDSTERLSRRAIIALSIIGCLALISFPFAPLGIGMAAAFLIVFSALVVAATIAWTIGRPQRLRQHDFLAPAPAVLVWMLALMTLASSLPDRLLAPRERQLWPVGASEQLVRGLYELGYTFPQLIAALQRQSPGTIEHMLAMLDPNPFGAPEQVDGRDSSLLALMVEPSVVERTEGVLLSFPFNRSRSALVVRAPSYLDRTRVRTCYSACDAEQPPSDACTERLPERGVSRVPPYFQMSAAELPEPGKALSFQPTGSRYCIAFSVPVQTPGSGVSHIVRVSEQWPLEIRITRASGIDFDGQLPGTEIRIVDHRPSTGTIEVEVRRDGFGPDSDWLEEPPLIEVVAANEHLLEPFRSGRATRW